MDEDFKSKFDISEMNFNCLKRLAHAAVLDYECLRLKYEQNQEQYDQLLTKLKETEEKLANLQNVLEPACNEYNNLNLQLEVEIACRSEAEKFASQKYKENSKLKRQSQMLLEKLGNINIADLSSTLETIVDEDTCTANNDYQNSAFADKITVLENEVKQLERKLFDSETQRAKAIQREEEITAKCVRLERELMQACKRLEDREEEMKSFSRVSQLAYEEFFEIKEKYQSQIVLTRAAEEVAHQMYVNNESLRRQSTLLMTNDVIGDARLCKALLEIEELTESLEKVKHENKQKIEELEKALASDRLGSLELELQLADGEVTRLQKALQEMDDWKVKLVEENKSLKDRLDEMTRPPPAPPCPVLPVITNMTPRRLLSTTQKVRSPAINNNDVKTALMENALQEMMSRIKSGNGLKPLATSRTPSVDKQVSAESPMGELQQLLGRMGRLNSVNNDNNATRSPFAPSSGTPGNSAKVLPILSRSSSQSAPPVIKPKPQRNASLSGSTTTGRTLEPVTEIQTGRKPGNADSTKF